MSGGNAKPFQSAFVESIFYPGSAAIAWRILYPRAYLGMNKAFGDFCEAICIGKGDAQVREDIANGLQLDAPRSVLSFLDIEVGVGDDICAHGYIQQRELVDSHCRRKFVVKEIAF